MIPENTPMLNRIALSTTASSLKEEARALAKALHLPFEQGPITADSPYAYFLLLTPEYLGLLKTKDKKALPFYIDFASAKLTYRRQKASLRKEMLARAMGIHPKENPVIVDATAGLGRDSFILASLGYAITMIEQSPILAALLKDALDRGKANAAIAPIVGRIKLICANSCDWLNATPEADRPDIITLDPMFPERKKSASVKKEMLILQELLGKCEDEDTLLQTALACAKRRVVVKRPKTAASIAKRAPNFSLTGKTSRFDIYLK